MWGKQYHRERRRIFPIRIQFKLHILTDTIGIEMESYKRRGEGIERRRSKQMKCYQITYPIHRTHMPFVCTAVVIERDKQAVGI